MNLCNSNCLLLTGRARSCWKWRHLILEPRKHPGLWNCSRPETSHKKQLFLIASISIIHGLSLCSPYGFLRPASTRDEKEGEQPAYRMSEQVGSQPQEWGLCSSLTAPQITHSISFRLEWQGQTQVRTMYRTAGAAPFFSPCLLSTGLRGAGISQAALARREDSAEQCQTYWQWDKATTACHQKLNLPWVHQKKAILLPPPPNWTEPF